MEFVSSDDAPKAIGPYSQAIRANGFLFTAGQTALNPKTGNLVEGGFEAEARQVFENLKAVLLAAKTDFSHVVKANVYLLDLGNFQKLNVIYAEYFGDHKPARTTVGVAQLPRGTQVEIDLVAVL